MTTFTDIFKKPKVTPPLPPPNTPSRATAEANITSGPTYQSLVSTGSLAGLRRKAETKKRTLIGGS